MKTPRLTYLLGLALLAIAPAIAADLNVTGNITATGTIDSDGTTVSFGAQPVGSANAGVIMTYTDSSTDTLKFLINRSPASWLWLHNSSVPAMRLDSSHNLLLYPTGANLTTTPASITLSPAANPSLALGTATLSNVSGVLTTSGALTVGGNIINTTGSLTGGSTGLTLNSGTAGMPVTLTAAGAGDIIFNAGGGERARIKSDGKVGIGTPGPGTKLHVLAGGFAGDGLRIEGNVTNQYPSLTFAANGAASPRSWTMSVRGGSAGQFNLDDGTAGFTRLAIDSAGNVGIGTIAPGLTLDVNGPVRSTSGSIDVRLQAGAAGAAGVGSFSNDPLLLLTAGIEKARITAAGNVGIGTTAPAERLEVNGSVNLSSNGQYYRTDVYSRLWTPGQAIGSAVYIGQYGPTLTYNAKFNAGWKLISGGVAGSLGLAEGRLVYSNSNSGNGGDAITWSDRFVVEPNGNVGIGTVSPSERLTVYGVVNSAPGILSLESNRQDLMNVEVGRLSGKNNGTEVNRISFYRGGGGIDGYLGFSTKYDNASALTEKVRIDGAGNVGIGTTAPATQLHAAGNGPALGAGINTQNFLASGTSGFIGYSLRRSDDTNGGWMLGTSAALAGDFALYQNQGASAAPVSRFLVTPSGNVGIGTTSPTHKLSVKGAIRAQEIIVDNTNWADYVFDESYALAPLSDVEAHIKAKKHLPGIPSAAEIAEHGVSMGDMQSKLLSKIEELTLHMIAQEKQMKAMQVAHQSEIAELRQQVGELRAAAHP